MKTISFLTQRITSTSARSLTTSTSPVSVVIDHAPRHPEIRPIIKGCPAWLEEKYAHFKPYYRDGTRAVQAYLQDIRYSEELTRYIALYSGDFGTEYHPRYESFVWVWIDKSMTEVEQVGVRTANGHRAIHSGMTLSANP